MNAFPMIAKCREHQLWADNAPPGVYPTAVMEGYVDIRYGSADGVPNNGTPFFMKLLGESVEELPISPLAAWDLDTFGDFD